MADRLTPEQLQFVINETAYDGGNLARIIPALEQAKRDARTLQRVQAWTENPAQSAINYDEMLIYGREQDVANAEALVKRCVAALLRAEEEEHPMRRVSAHIKEG